MATRIVLLLSITLSSVVQVVYGLNVSENVTGFKFLFTTSPAEFEDFPLHFEKPLAKWLRGDLVSFYLTVYFITMHQLTSSGKLTFLTKHM